MTSNGTKRYKIPNGECTLTPTKQIGSSKTKTPGVHPNVCSSLRSSIGPFMFSLVQYPFFKVSTLHDASIMVSKCPEVTDEHTQLHFEMSSALNYYMKKNNASIQSI
eukprot:653406_1